MQTGHSRELFELWAPDSRNGLIITGYSIEGTLARVSDISTARISIYRVYTCAMEIFFCVSDPSGREIDLLFLLF